MSAFDFTYSLPQNYDVRIIQFLQQMGRNDISAAYKRCSYEYEDVGLAFYAGLRGDNWDKHAIDINIEGSKEDLSLLDSNYEVIEKVIKKSLKSDESGLVLRKIYYLEEVSDWLLPENNEERLNADIEAANGVLKDILWIGEKICSNNTYNSMSLEDSMNDYFRDMLLGKGYDETKDQTRHGISSNGKRAGEVDLLITKAGSEIAIIEGLKLNSVNSSYIDEHIEKAIDNYNALGTPTFIIAYVSSSDFAGFWVRYLCHIKKHIYEVNVKREINEMTHPNASARVANAIFSRDGYDFPIYFIALKIR